MTRDQVFISYSHADSEWLKRLQTMLAPLQRQGTLDLWVDTRIQPGQLWKEEIQKALARAKVAVLLVSPDFLASDFIIKDELAPLLHAAKQEGLTILWVPLEFSLYEETDIARYQAAHNPKIPLSTLPVAQQNEVLWRLAQRLKAILPLSSPAPAPGLAPTTIPIPEQVPSSPSPPPSSPPPSPRSDWKRLLVVLMVGILGGAGVYYVGYKWFEQVSIQTTSPVANPVQNIHGWSARQVQDLQKQTAEALKLNVEFSDPLKDGDRGPLMVVIPAGRFQMGSPATELERQDNERQHEVEVKAFAIGKYAITVGQFKHFVEAAKYKTEVEKSGGCYYWAGSDWKQDANKNWQNPGFSQTDSHPAVCITWNDAMEYVNWLNRQTDQQYHLPTEAEWEYAARAGTTTPFYFGATISTNQANYNGNYVYDGGHRGEYRQKTLEVGYFGLTAANAWGLYDMHGNVDEWTCSAYSENYDGNEQRCVEPGTSSPCVLRGGSWTDDPRWLRGAARINWCPPSGDQYNGFRLARTFPSTL